MEIAQPQMFTEEVEGPETNLADFLLYAAAEVPDKVCVETDTGCYTYAQLARMVGSVRTVLRRALGRCEEVREAAALAEDEDSKPEFHRRRRDEHLVCIVLDRGPECLAAVHATMLEGCVYNTFDAAEPREKLKTWVEIGEHPVMITSRPVMERLGLTERGWKFGGEHPRLVLDIHEVLRKGFDKVDAPLPAPAQRKSDLERLCYVIFTSGSTGKPKAVMINHRSACNLVRVWSNFVGLQREDRIAQMASMAFDNHVPEIYGAMFKRCTSVVVPDLMKRSGPDMLGWLNSKRINLMVTVPSHLRSMSGAGVDVSTEALPHLRVLDIGGEALGRDVLDTWAPGRSLFNIYGPTEMTVVCAGCRVQPGDEITIGYDLPTYKNVVLDPETLKECPVGVRGVLYTGGVGTGRGYMDDEAKTSGKFVQVPGFGRMYCSGDVVSKDTMGRFHYHGRADWQVKVRGIRIELEALEEAVGNVEGVKHCEARVVEGGAKLALIASGVDIEEGPIKEAAAKLGKGYVLNIVKIVEHSAWKFNTSGKLVRNHVPLMEATSDEAGGPRDGWEGFNQDETSELEREIAASVAQLITAESWGKESHFIEDLGLDSAGFGKLITLMRRKEALKMVDLPTLFENPTVAALASTVESQQESEEEEECDNEASLDSNIEALEDLLLANCESATADAHKHALCVEVTSGSCTYAQIYQRALAAQVLLRKSLRETRSSPLREQGVVALILDNSAELLVAMIATLLERHSFCILDPQQPSEVLIDQICLVRPCAIFTDPKNLVRPFPLQELRSRLIELGVRELIALVNVDSVMTLLTKPLPTLRRPQRAAPICCVAVTTDATGRSQAVEFEHSAVRWAAKAWQGSMDIRPEDRVVQMLAPSSLPAVVGLWASLGAGATLLIPPAGMLPGAGLRTFLKTRHVTVLGAMPSQLHVLGMEGAASLHSLRLVWATGANGRAELAERWATGRTFVHAYCRPEVAAACAFHAKPADAAARGQMMPLGRALPGCQLHILNERLEPVAQGEKGTLFIGGPGLALGYLNRSGSESSFVEVEGLGRLFRTKDTVVRDELDGVELYDQAVHGAAYVRGGSGYGLPTIKEGGHGLPNDSGGPRFTRRDSAKTGIATPSRQPMARRADSSFRSFRRYLIQTFDERLTKVGDPYGEEAWVGLCLFVQSAYLVAELLLSVVNLLLLERFVLPYMLYGNFLYGILLTIGLQLLQQFLQVAHLLAAKWLLIGRYQEGDYAIYSIYYLKHWIVDRAASRTILGAGGAQGGWNFTMGRNFAKVLLLKALGCDVALSAQVTARITGFDLVSIGALASVHGPHHITAVSFVGKRMHVGRQEIGRGATICHGSCVAPGAIVTEDAFVEPLTSIPAGAVVEGRWSGVPGRQVGPTSCGAARVYSNGCDDDCSNLDESQCSDEATSEAAERRMVRAGALFAFGSLLLVPLNLATLIGSMWLARMYIDSMDGTTWDDSHGADVLPPEIINNLWILTVAGLAFTILSEIVNMAMPVLACRLLPKVRPPMDVPIYSWRAQLAALKLNLASKASEELGDASIQAAYLRLCGAKIGRGSSMSEQTVLPETLEVGEDCFFASGNTLLNVLVDQGRMKIPTKTVIASGAFLGNENHIAEGLQPETFVGLRTWVPKMPAGGGSLFGNPAMRFGRPPAAEGAKDATRLQILWHHLSTSFVDVFFWKALHSVSTGIAFTIGRTLYPEYPEGHWILPLIVELKIFAGVRLLSWFLVAVVFANVIYNDRMPLSAPFYSTVITRWFSANKIRKVFKKPFRTGGTMWDATFMRLLGVKVGSRYFSPNEDVMIDPPFGRLGDDITVDYDGQVRQHSFEDDVLKWGPNYIGNGTTIMQAGMVAMSDCSERVMLLRGSVTWKGQVLEPNMSYEGAPAAPVSADLEANLCTAI